VIRRHRKIASTNLLFVVLAIAFGAVDASSLLGVDKLDPTNIRWLSGDTAQHYLGWAFLREDPHVQFPLTWTSRLGYPLGLSISFLDSIPIVALALRPFSAMLPQPVQYHGLYACLALILLTYFGFKIFHRLCGGSIFWALFGGVLILLSPIATYRLFGHFSLVSHWLILWALYHYSSDEIGAVGRWMRPFWIILAIAGGVTPYLGTMCLLVALTACSRLVLERRTSAARAMGLAGLAVATLACSLLFFGFLIIGRDSTGYRGGGYGFYSMNLLAPVNPMGYGSMLLPALPTVTTGQDDGYNYLGLGVLFLLILATARGVGSWRRLREPRTLPLVGLGIVCLLLSVSTTVTVGPHVLFEIKTPKPIGFFLESLRASGRLFWPAYYVLLIAAVVGVWRFSKPAHGRLLLVIAVALQMADLDSLRSQVRRRAMQEPPDVLQAAEWSTLGRSHAHLMVLPAWQCAEKSPGGKAGYWIFGRLATNQNMTLNSYYKARLTTKELDLHCKTIPEAVKKGHVDPDAVYVVNKEFLAAMAEAGVTSHRCARVDGYNVCTRDPTGGGVRPYWLTLRESYRTIAIVVFDTRGQAQGYEAGGWAGPEDWGTWTEGPEATLIIPLAKVPQDDLLLLADTGAFVGNQHPQQEVDLLVNGVLVAQWSFRLQESVDERRAVIPADVGRRENPMRVTFRIHHPTSPAHVRLSDDPRLLGLSMRRLRIFAAAPAVESVWSPNARPED
jgi:hypothetical protein